MFDPEAARPLGDHGGSELAEVIDTHAGAIAALAGKIDSTCVEAKLPVPAVLVALLAIIQKALQHQGGPIRLEMTVLAAHTVVTASNMPLCDCLKGECGG